MRSLSNGLATLCVFIYFGDDRNKQRPRLAGWIGFLGVVVISKDGAIENLSAYIIIARYFIGYDFGQQAQASGSHIS